LKGVLRARREKIITWRAKDLEIDKKRIGLDGSATQVIKVFTPSPPSGGEIISGEIPEIAEILIKKLKERKII